MLPYYCEHRHFNIRYLSRDVFNYSFCQWLRSSLSPFLLLRMSCKINHPDSHRYIFVSTFIEISSFGLKIESYNQNHFRIIAIKTLDQSCFDLLLFTTSKSLMDVLHNPHRLVLVKPPQCFTLPSRGRRGLMQLPLPLSRTDRRHTWPTALVPGEAEV